jgi:hypothetical protein
MRGLYVTSGIWHETLEAMFDVVGWRWFGRACGFTLLYIVLGWVLGATLGLLSPVATIIVAVIGLFLAGGAVASRSVGGAGLVAGFIGVVATVGITFEGRKAWVLRRVPITEIQSLDAWPEPFEAVHLPGLRQRREAELWEHWSNGSGSRASHHSYTVTPVVSEASGDVVAFSCRRASSRALADGDWFVREALLDYETGPLCDVAVEAALPRFVANGAKVARGAQSRVVHIFGSEQELREGGELEKAFQIPLAFFAMFVVGALFMRNKASRG